MYEYTPQRKKTREIMTALMIFGVGIVIYYLSQIPGVRYPVFYQMGTLVLAAISVLIVGRYVMRNYTYRIEPRDNDPAARDLVIVEHYGRRDTTVCRIGLEEIRRVVRPGKNNRKELAAGQKGNRVYRYTAEFSAPDLCVVEARAEECSTGESVFLRICADEALFDLLSRSNSNICPSDNEK